jgi:hypothetical protein
MDAKKLVIIFAVLLMLSGGTISVLKWLKIGPFSDSVEVTDEETAPDEPPVAIDMDKLSIPIFAEDRVTATILIELKVDAIGAENQEMIIKLLPRLSDAFFKDLYVFIPRIIRRKNKLTTNILSERMKQTADKILGPGVIHSVIILKVTES